MSLLIVEIRHSGSHLLEGSLVVCRLSWGDAQPAVWY